MPHFVTLILLVIDIAISITITRTITKREKETSQTRRTKPQKGEDDGLGRCPEVAMSRRTLKTVQPREGIVAPDSHADGHLWHLFLALQ